MKGVLHVGLSEDADMNVKKGSEINLVLNA